MKREDGTKHPDQNGKAISLPTMSAISGLDQRYEVHAANTGMEPRRGGGEICTKVKYCCSDTRENAIRPLLSASLAGVDSQTHVFCYKATYSIPVNSPIGAQTTCKANRGIMPKLDVNGNASPNGQGPHNDCAGFYEARMSVIGQFAGPQTTWTKGWGAVPTC